MHNVLNCCPIWFRCIAHLVGPTRKIKVVATRETFSWLKCTKNPLVAGVPIWELIALPDSLYPDLWVFLAGRPTKQYGNEGEKKEREGDEKGGRGELMTPKVYPSMSLGPPSLECGCPRDCWLTSRLAQFICNGCASWFGKLDAKYYKFYSTSTIL